MANHRLSLEQKFCLEAAFREIDACEDIDVLRALTKQIIASQENEKAFVREAVVRFEGDGSRSLAKSWNPLETKGSRFLSGLIESVRNEGSSGHSEQVTSFVVVPQFNWTLMKTQIDHSLARE